MTALTPLPLHPPIYLYGWGHALPARVVSNADLVAQGMDTSDEWITERTGIRQRYILGPAESVVGLAQQAAQNALTAAQANASVVDLVVLATSTPELSFPATATLVQAALGVQRGAAYDVQAACSGFIYALASAADQLRLGRATTAVVIGVDAFSAFIDWQDRSTAVLFGDGAGAVVLSTRPPGPGVPYDVVLGYDTQSDGQYATALQATGGVGRTQTAGSIVMNGREGFKHAVRTMASHVTQTLSTCGVPLADVALVVPHQANERILAGVAAQLSLPEAQVLSTVAQHGNTSAASIPLAVSTAVPVLQAGQNWVLTAFGAGFTWGTVVLRRQAPIA